MMNVRIDGLDNLIDKTSELERRVQRRVATKAARRAAWVIARQARINAKQIDDPDTPEDISKNITVQAAARLGRAHNGVAMRVGVRGGAKKSVAKAMKSTRGGDTWYWRFLEFGTRRTAAKPFLRPAVAQKSSAAFDEFAEVMNAEINKEVGSL